MTNDSETGEATPLSPDEAFSVLGDQARLGILRALATADGPLAYVELYDAVEYDDSSNFSYHLDKLVGHFVRKTDDGYRLYDAGRRVVEAVVSGAVTDTRGRTDRDRKAVPFLWSRGHRGFPARSGRTELYRMSRAAQIRRVGWATVHRVRVARVLPAPAGWRPRPVAPGDAGGRVDVAARRLPDGQRRGLLAVLCQTRNVRRRVREPRR